MTKEDIFKKIQELDPEAKFSDEVTHAEWTAKLAELKVEATKAATVAEILELDSKAELDGLDQAELTAKLAELKPDPKTAAEDAAAAKETAQAKKAEKIEQIKAKKPPYYVAPGKAITTKRGILGGKPADEVGPETEIKKKYLSDGGTSFERWIKLGYIIKG